MGNRLTPWVCVALACVVAPASAAIVRAPGALQEARWSAIVVAARAKARERIRLPRVAPTRARVAPRKTASLQIASTTSAPPLPAAWTLGRRVLPLSLPGSGAVAHVDVVQTATAGTPRDYRLASTDTRDAGHGRMWLYPSATDARVVVRSKGPARGRAASSGPVDIWLRRRRRVA